MGSDKTYDHDEEAGPNKGDHDATDQGILSINERAEQNPSQKGPDQSDENVANDPIAASSHEFPSQKACDQSNE